MSAVCTSVTQALPADDGAISLKSVLPGRGLATDPDSVRLAEPGRQDSTRKPVRDNQPLSVPPIPTVAEQSAAKPMKFVRPRGILLTASQDDAATVKVPDLTPPPVPGLTEVTPHSHPSAATANACQCQQCVNSRSAYRGRRSGGVGQKFKAGAKRVLSCFVEVEECDEIEFDVDDYRMPILLVAASDDIEPEPQVKNAASRLLSRKLTDIQPTLTYAYGEDAQRNLPEAFYQKVDYGVYQQQVGPKMVLQWEPTNLWYYPLYFEDVGLERYGHTHKPWVQPFVSTGKFFGQVVGMPYKMTLDSPHCPQYALGYYQPGEWAPKKKYQIPWNEEAAATQFLWMTGFFLLVP